MMTSQEPHQCDQQQATVREEYFFSGDNSDTLPFHRNEVKQM
jgi:hypothetical protein